MQNRSLILEWLIYFSLTHFSFLYPLDSTHFEFNLESRLHSSTKLSENIQTITNHFQCIMFDCTKKGNLKVAENLVSFNIHDKNQYWKWLMLLLLKKMSILFLFSCVLNVQHTRLYVECVNVCGHIIIFCFGKIHAKFMICILKWKMVDGWSLLLFLFRCVYSSM